MLFLHIKELTIDAILIRYLYDARLPKTYNTSVNGLKQENLFRTNKASDLNGFPIQFRTNLVLDYSNAFVFRSHMLLKGLAFLIGRFGIQEQALNRQVSP